MSQPILALVRDLMFASKISTTARSLSIEVIMLRDGAKLADHDAAGKLIVDLNQPGALEAAAEWKRRTGGAVVGFTSHVDTDTIMRAKALGIDQVLARSAFVQQLPQLLGDEL